MPWKTFSSPFDAIQRHWFWSTLVDCLVAWWRHQRETFSALLALCTGNSPVTGGFPHKGQLRGALKFSLICAWTRGWVNHRDAGDLRWLWCSLWRHSNGTQPSVRKPGNNLMHTQFTCSVYHKDVFENDIMKTRQFPGINEVRLLFPWSFWPMEGRGP